AGHSIASFAERPDLDDALRAFNVDIFEPFMNEDEVANRLFGRAYDDWPQFQLFLLDPPGAIAAIGNAMPLWWDGSDDGLPDGWDDQVLRSAADLDSGRSPNTLGAMLIVVSPSLRGGGIA